MDQTARLPLGARRWQPYVKTFRFRGVDLTGATLQAQIRLYPNAPGAPLVDLLTVTNGNAEGLRIISVADDGGVPVTTVALKVNETTVEGLPFAGEAGADTVLAYDMQVTPTAGSKQVWIEGEFWVLSAVTGAGGAVPSGAAFDGSPRKRPAFSAGPASFMVGDSIVVVTMAGGEGPRGKDGLSAVADRVDYVAGEGGQARFAIPFPYDADKLLPLVDGRAVQDRTLYSFDEATGDIIFDPTIAEGLAVTLYSSLPSSGGGGGPITVSEQTFLVSYQEGETTDSAAVRRARDAIAAAGGGRMLFVDGAGSRDDGHFLVGEMTQNGDPTNSGNLCSNLTIERTGAAQIWKDPALPFMFFHNPVGIGTVEEPDVQGPTIRNVRIGAIECMDDVEFLGFSEQEAFFHLNAVADVIFDGTRMIGQRGDAICLNAGDIGGGSQNRFNEGITLRDIFIDGINRNNRNGVSIVSGEKISFEGRCIIKNVTRPGGPGALDLFDINTGVGMPGGVDIEPNAFTADSRTRDITGRIYVINCGGAALGRLMFGQDALPVQHRGIVMEVHAEQCRVGMLSYYGGEDDVTGTDVTLVDSSAVDCDRPFSILRGRGLRMIRPTFYRCPNPAEIGYVDGQSIKDWLMTDAVFDQCGGNGAMLRPLGMDGVEWRNMTVRNCAGGLVQFVGDGTIANFTYDMKIVQDAGAQLSAPTGRFVVNTETGTPDLHVNTIVERSASGYFVPDSAAWQVLGKRSRTVPHTGTWGAGDEVPAVRGLEPGSPRRWLAILPNVLPAKPIFVVDGILPGAAPDPATDSASIVFAKSANMVANGNGRFTAARADQYLYDDNVNNFGVTNGAVGAEMIFAMPYSGTGAIYAGLSKIVQPTTLADLTAGFWFDGEGSALRLIVEGGLYGTEAQALPFAYGGQVRVKCLYEGGAPTATFYRRPGTSGAWTQIDTPVALPTVTVMRLFVLMSYASETLHIVKAGTN